MKKHLAFVLIMLLLLPVGCSAESPDPTEQPGSSLPNLASVFCEQRGYTLQMREGTGGTAGYCLFPDGTECEEWAYFRGECAPGGSVWGSETLELTVLESFPVRVHAQISGTLPDTCSRIDRVTQTYDDGSGVFMLEPLMITTAGSGCRPDRTPFTEVVELEVLGIRAGEYRVEIGKLSATFSLSADNLPPADSGLEPEPVDPALAGWPLITNPVYGFSFHIPPDWVMTETTDPVHTLSGHQMQIAPVTGGEVVMSIAYKAADDPMRITRGGMREGEFVAAGNIDFLGSPVAKARLVFEGKLMGVYYDGAAEVLREPLVFTLALDYLGDSRSGAGIAAEYERIADAIVASFSLESGP